MAAVPPPDDESPRPAADGSRPSRALAWLAGRFGAWRVELGSGLRAWRDLVAIGRYIRRQSGPWDEVYSAAMLADAALVLRWDLTLSLALRHMWAGLFRDGVRTLTAAEAENLGFVNARAGHIAEAMRLAEHAGAEDAFGHRPDDDIGPGLRAAAQGPATFRLSFLGMKRRVPASIVADYAFGTVRRLRWLPGRLADELFPVSLAILEELLEPVGEAGPRRTDALTPYPLVRWWRRRRRRRPDPDDGRLRLSFRADMVDIMFRAEAGGLSVEAMCGPIFPPAPGERPQLMSRGYLINLLLSFHRFSRTAPAGALELLRVGGIAVEAAIARLGPAELPRRLTIRASGLMRSMPWSALRCGDGTWLAEKFEIDVDDGFGRMAAGARTPRLTALAGTSPFMVREAAAVAGIASEAGFPADPPMPLTRGRLEAALSGSTIAHLATHFRVNPHLAGAGELQLADGTWLALDAIEADLDGLELLFLAACETGVALDDSDQPDGSAADHWRAAGAAAVVSTLWRVNDEIGPLIAAPFYRLLLDGGTAAAALAAGQRHLLGGGPAAQRRERYLSLAGDTGPAPPFDTAHPRMWGAFRLSGDGGPVRQPCRTHGTMESGNTARLVETPAR